MLNNLLDAAAGLRSGSPAPTMLLPPFAPYVSRATNGIYNLLFSDNTTVFKPKRSVSPAPWQAILFSSPPDFAALEALAADAAQEGQIRYLAYARLRRHGQPVRPKILLGVIIEVRLPDGLDTLAAFSDGGVHYINQSGKQIAIRNSLKTMVGELLDASDSVVAQIGPWSKARQPPPVRGNIRLSFLVSDGLYFGEGPMAAMQREPMAGPIIRHATELLSVLGKMDSD
ncbi:MAG: hypothetical protein V4857_05995 [Pseudomonadota bacterium]